MRNFFGQVEHKLNLKLMVVGGITFISCQSMEHSDKAIDQSVLQLMVKNTYLQTIHSS